MNKLSLLKQTQILGMLVEGNSLRTTSRLVGCSINTVTKLLVDLGCATSEYQYKTLRHLPCKRVQVDEIWSFCYSKQKNVPEEKQGEFGYGDIWTWTAICGDTKIVPTWLVGTRNAESAQAFVSDLASRIDHRIQLTSDGHKPYIEAIEQAFGPDVDYAMLQKIYGSAKEEQKRYSPADCIGCVKKRINGKPDPKYISTSFAERQNLTMRMSMRRFTRLTNGFSKKVENHAHAIAVHFMYYNFGRVHKTIKTTPAIKAGVADHVWGLEEIVSLLNECSN